MVDTVGMANVYRDPSRGAGELDRTSRHLRLFEHLPGFDCALRRSAQRLGWAPGNADGTESRCLRDLLNSSPHTWPVAPVPAGG